MSFTPADKAAEYRRLAKETRDIAQWISIRDAREELLATAKQLEAAAEALDAVAQANERLAEDATYPKPKA